MSAICGMVRFDGRPVELSELETMVESSPYRGPDGSSYFLQENAGFAHLAFHVTPESVHEKQPLISEDGRLVLVADVRLDNREELAGKLGDSFDCAQGGLPQDSWLILEAFRRWGEACVDHLLRDYVFAVWNAEDRELFLARDSLGAYSLSWHKMGDTLVFASETTAILDLPFIDPKLKQTNIAKVLAHLPRGADETFFEDI